MTLARIQPSLAVVLAGSAILGLFGVLVDRPGAGLLGMVLAAVAVAGVPRVRGIRLAAEVSVPDTQPHEGDALPVDIRLQNQGASKFVEWRLRLPDLSEPQGATHSRLSLLNRRAALELRPEVKFGLFGVNQVGPLEAIVRDPFGFTAIPLTLAPAQSIRVYPERESVVDPPLRSRQQRALMGVYEVSQQGYGFEFYGLRPYAVGDRPRDVNWKASARTGNMIVNQRQKESDTEAVILVDLRSSSKVGLLTRSPFARSCRAAVAVGQAHLLARDAIRLITYGARAHEDNHTGPTRKLQGILDQVVEAQAEGSQPLLDVVHGVLPSLRPRSPILVVSHLVGDSTVSEALALLRSHGFPLQVLVPVPTWTRQTPATRRWLDEQADKKRAVQAVGVPCASITPEGNLESALVELVVVRS